MAAKKSQNDAGAPRGPEIDTSRGRPPMEGDDQGSDPAEVVGDEGGGDEQPELEDE